MSCTLLSRLTTAADHLATSAAFEAAIYAIAARRGIAAEDVRAAPTKNGARRGVTYKRDASGRYSGSGGVPPSPRAEAIYLTHTVFGRSLRSIARVTGMSKPGVLWLISNVESNRDDPQIDRALDEVELELLG